jgi:hypothetical protein
MKYEYSYFSEMMELYHKLQKCLDPINEAGIRISFTEYYPSSEYIPFFIEILSLNWAHYYHDWEDITLKIATDAGFIEWTFPMGPHKKVCIIECAINRNKQIEWHTSFM